MLKLIGALGLGSIIAVFIQRAFSRRDRSTEVHITNAAKEIESDDRFRTDLIHRIEKLEERIDKLQGELSTAMAANAKLSAENAALHRDNVRLESEIKELRARQRKDTDTIAELRTELDALTAQVQGQTGRRGI